MRTFTLWKCANASSTTIVIQSQRSPQGFQPFYIPNTCHSPAFFSRKLRANICTERKYLQCTSPSAICHIPPLTPNLIVGQRQDWQLASEQSGSRLCNRPSQGSLCLCLDYQRVHLNFNYPHLFQRKASCPSILRPWDGKIDSRDENESGGICAEHKMHNRVYYYLVL